MTDEKTWDELSDYYAGHTPEIIREIQVPDRALTADDLDDIFAGRPLADQPRPKADILAKTYLRGPQCHEERGHRHVRTVAKGAGQLS